MVTTWFIKSRINIDMVAIKDKKLGDKTNLWEEIFILLPAALCGCQASDFAGFVLFKSVNILLKVLCSPRRKPLLYLRKIKKKKKVGGTLLQTGVLFFDLQASVYGANISYFRLYTFILEEYLVEAAV